jgi:hypothetical protein
MIRYSSRFYTSSEERILEREMNHPNKNTTTLREKQLFCWLTALLILAFCIHFSSVSAYEPELESDAQLFPETWICSDCGYENYEGISTCAQCGGG